MQAYNERGLPVIIIIIIKEEKKRDLKTGASTLNIFMCEFSKKKKYIL